MILRLTMMKGSGNASHNQIQSYVLFFKIRNIEGLLHPSWGVWSWGKGWLYHQHSFGFCGLWLSPTFREWVLLVLSGCMWWGLWPGLSRKSTSWKPGPLSPEEFDLIPLTNTNTGTISFGHFKKQKSRPGVVARPVLAVKHERPGPEDTCVKGDMHVQS